MTVSAKSIPTSDTKTCDLNAIYSRIIAMLSSTLDLDVRYVFAHELAPVPTAMFTEKGMRLAKNKAALKRSLQVEVSCRNAGCADVIDCYRCICSTVDHTLARTGDSTGLRCKP